MEKLMAYCGLMCNECPAYIATINDDHDTKVRLAKEWTNDEFNIEPKDIDCLGCRSEGKTATFCAVCPTRLCAIEKGVAFCADCPDYACEKLEPVFNMSPDARDNLEKMRKKGPV